jgi:hypothetical protein
MHSRTDLCLVTVLVGTTIGCDEPYADDGDFDDPPVTEATPKVAAPRGPVSLEYEDRDDFGILNDRSNLRRSELSPLEHRQWLNFRFRDELVQEMEGVEFPTDEEIASLSIRWFVTGAGIVVQNPTERQFTVSAYFSATTESGACGVAVPMRVVAAGASAMLTPQAPSDCVIERADVSVTDEYGFLVNLIAVEAEEREP